MSQQPSEISRTPIVKKNNRPAPFLRANSNPAKPNYRQPLLRTQIHKQASPTAQPSTGDYLLICTQIKGVCICSG